MAGSRAVRAGKMGLAALLGGLYFGLAAIMVVFDRLPVDFYHYYTAASRIQAGQSAYLPFSLTGPSFLYHPFALSAVTWILRFERETGYAIWIALSLAAYVAAMAALLGVTNRWLADAGGRLGLPGQLLLGAVFLGFRPLLQTFKQGQINLFVLLAIALCLYFSEAERPHLAGFFLGLAAILKLSPALLFLYFLAVRRYRTVATGALTVIGLSLVAWAQFGSQVFLDFAATVGILMGQTHMARANHSLSVYLINALGGVNPTGMLGAVVIYGPKLILWGVAGLGAALAWWPGGDQAWQQGSTGRTARLWLFALLVTVMTLSSPLVWAHHLTFLVIPLLLLLARQETRWWGAGLVFLFQIEPLLGGLLAPVWVAGTALVAGEVLVLAGVTALCLRSLTAGQRRQQADPARAG